MGPGTGFRGNKHSRVGGWATSWELWKSGSWNMLKMQFSSPFLLVTVFLRDNSHTIQFSHWECRSQWPLVYSLHHNQSRNVFIATKRNPVPFSRYPLFPLPPHPPGALGNHWSILGLYGFACVRHFIEMESCSICPLRLVSFTCHDVSKVRPHCSVRQYAIPFYCQIIFRDMATAHFIYSFTSWWMLVFLPFISCE